jgi:glycosyltransferase involved in cell wall biosynthesis
MDPLVTICIPTYNRPVLVREAVDSALGQSYPAIEVIVSDDSQDDRTKQALADVLAVGGVRYVQNKPALRQAGNVNQLFDLARGELLVLLHDDDLLLPDAVVVLANCFNAYPSIAAAYGKQYLIDLNGKVDEDGSVALNAYYRRTAEHVGRQRSSLESALTGQFPNDGFMIRSSIAREVRYRDDASVGDACDFDFGLRLAGIADGFYFLDQYTAKYRLTGVSLSTGNNCTNLTFDLLVAADLPSELEPTRCERLQTYAIPAVNQWLQLGNWRAAFRVYTSSVYGWTKRLSPQGLAQAALLCCPPVLSKRTVAVLRRIRRGW